MLLLGSESWSLLPSSLKSLEGFHVRAVKSMTGLMPKKRHDGSCQYSDSAEVLKSARLHTVREYIQVRRHIVLEFIFQRPIHGYCMEAGRNQGYGSHIY